MKLRPATLEDMGSITQIYAHNVLYGTGTFALEPPPQSYMTERFQAINSMQLPYLVATEDDAILGFAYASPFRERPGYRYGVEDSIYLCPEAQGKGIGKALLNRLIEDSIKRGLYTMIAVIGDSENSASIGVHKACGFVETGRLPNAGYKFSRWLDVVFMCRELKQITKAPEGDGWAAT